MDQSTAILTATVILVVLIVAVSYAWYHLIGWQTFTVTEDSQRVASVSGAGKDIRHLRFRNCMFTSTIGEAPHHPVDVSAVLNGMAMAYMDAPATTSTVHAAPVYLDLISPINALSFKIEGWNTEDIIKQVNLVGSSGSLTGQYRII